MRHPGREPRFLTRHRRNILARARLLSEMPRCTILALVLLGLHSGCSVAPECASALCEAAPGTSGPGDVADSSSTDNGMGDDDSGTLDDSGSEGTTAGAGDGDGTADTSNETGDCADGSSEACAAADCVALLDAGAHDGVYWIAPDGAAPFEVYCDMQTAGGGWALVWKQHGGARGGEVSTASLLTGPGNPGAILPPEQVLVSEKSAPAFDHYFSSPGREWLERSVLWDGDGSVVRSLTLRLGFSDDALADVFAADDFCTRLDGPVAVFVDDQSIGQTDWVLRNSSDGVPVNYGLAHDGLDGAPETHCGEDPASSTNLIETSDDSADGGLLGQARLNGAGSVTINNVFSYRHHEDGPDASRCTFTCWGSSGNDVPDDGYYDASVWAVR